MEIESNFISLSTKFLFINCGGSFETNSSELNILLNELNGLDYKNQQITDARAAVRLIESFVNIPVNEDTLIVKACCLIKTLVNKQKISIPSGVSAATIGWLLKCLDKCFYRILCDALGTLQVLLKQCQEHVHLFYDSLISTNGILINLLNDPYYNKLEKKNYETSSPDQIYLSVILCIEAILSTSEENVIDEQKKLNCLEVVGRAILNLIFKIKADQFSEVHYYNLIISSFNSLRCITVQHDEWSGEHLGEMFGAAKAFMMKGIPNMNQLEPQKIMVSQQGVPEPQHIPINKGGKIPKTRKPRTSNKVKKADNKKKTTNHEDNFRQPYSDSNIVMELSTTTAPNCAYRTSDSDFSETEANRAQIDRHKLAKLRQTSLILIGTLAQYIEKRVVFGYWHSFFPTENGSHSTISLLSCVLRDPSPKCRIAALQATSFMLYKSKPFLIQAESSDKPPSTFTPFSIALGNMIITMYEMLTQALSGESDLSVLTQILKSITVFIQATPFHRLRKGIVTNFVKYIRILVRHKDPTIKVAALRVMGFLISVSEITQEISEIVGIPKVEIIRKRVDTRNKNITDAVDMNNEDEEELIESDGEMDFLDESLSREAEKAVKNDKKIKMSWLLQISLEYLGVAVSDLKKSSPSAVMPVRMESLQVLSAMATHYSLLKEHLDFIAIALINSFNDPISEIKLYAGRVLDILGHAINNSLLFQVSMDPEELNSSLKFWMSMLPAVTDQIQDIKQNPSLRAICCDALGNIGVHVFEKLTHDKHIVLVSLLTGSSYDEDSLIKAAAVRALSVYILFPSLRDDICYVENTIDSILRILDDPNISARVKASWSLGNITDALIINNTDPKIERINDDLLLKILENTIKASNDNDKVRCNSVRTIGNVLRLLKPEHLRSTLWGDLCTKAVEKLVQNVVATNNVKVKWNACYAIGNMMKNQFMFTDCQKVEWQKVVFPALCNVVINSSNFKVRINSASALTIAEQRPNYGVHFISIWSSLLKALEQSDNLIDYNEYKHRDNLQEQLCLSLSHFMNLSQKEDLTSMKNELFPLYDTTKLNWCRVMNRIIPEKSVKMLEAHLKIKNFAQSASINAESKSAAGTIASCFHTEMESL